VPNVRLRLIGKDTDGTLKPTEPDVDALGWVANPAEEIATWSAMIIPVHRGGGTRIKIADAFSRQCPAVSTPLGAFGYDVENGRQLMLADTAEDFGRACIELIKNPARGAELAAKGWRDFLEKWTWDAIAPKVWTAAEDCLRRSKR
jgi:glycosyltransferase involved in cell wall biosynthesis